MKKIYLSFFALASFFGSQAQLTQANHAPANGEMYDMQQCDVVSPGSGGANQVWNFSAINTQSTILHYTAMSVSSSTYPLANVAVASAANDIAYLASSAGSLLYYGGNINAGTVAGSLTYTAPAVRALYPMSLNTTSSSVIGGTVSVTSPPTTGTFGGNSHVIVDGSGTLTLPGSQVWPNVLRVVTSQTILISAFTTATVNQVNYDYYDASVKEPIFTITTYTAIVNGFPGASTQTMVTRNKNATPPPPVGIQNVHSNGGFEVYPNPAINWVTFASDDKAPKKLMIYDITGKLIDKQNLNDGKLKLDVSGYAKGLYLYTLLGGNDEKLKTGRFTVSQ